MVARLTGRLGRLKLGAVTRGAMERALDAEFEGLAAATRRRACSTLGGVLSRAVELGWLAAAPAIPWPRQAERKVNKWLWPREIELLVNCAPRWFRPQMMFLFYQGRRPGESVALAWEDVDLRPGAERFRLPTTKTGAEQWSPLRPETAAMLRVLRERRLAAGHALKGRVFLTSRGEPWHETRGLYGGVMKKPWAKARERAAAVIGRLARRRRAAGRLDEAADLERRAGAVLASTPHWGRHSFASLGIMGGVPGKAIQDAAGWASGQVLDRHYSHLADAALRESFGRMAAPRIRL